MITYLIVGIVGVIAGVLLCDISHAYETRGLQRELREEKRRRALAERKLADLAGIKSKVKVMSKYV